MKKEIIFENNSPIKIEIFNIIDYPWHFHSDMQIFYMLEGAVDLKVSQFRKKIKKGDIHVVQTGDIHGFSNGTEDNRVLILSLRNDYFNRFFPEFGNDIYSTHMANTERDKNIINKLRSMIILHYCMFNLNGEDNRQKKEQSAYDLVVFLRNNFRSITLNDSCLLEHRNEYSRLQEGRVLRTIQHIYTNYEKKITLAQMAERENVSSFYFSHLMHKFTGKPFREFISLLRAEISEAMLLDTNYSISKIANEVGFSNYIYYVKYFKEFFGYSPAEYREKFKNDLITSPNAKVNCRDVASELDDYFRSYYEKMMPNMKGKTIEININQNDEDYSHNEKNKAGFTARHEIDLVFPVFSDVKENFSYKGKDLETEMMAPSNFLKKFSQSQESLKSITVIDNKNFQGLYTYNGLKKPLYYVYNFLRKMGVNLLLKNNCYLLSKGENSYTIILFNPNKETMDFNVKIKNELTETRIEEHFLETSNSVISIWKNIGFIPLSKEEVEAINFSTFPKVSLRKFEKSKIIWHQISLLRGEIVYLKITL